MATFFFAKKFSRGDSPGLGCGHFQTVLCSGLTSLGRGGPAILAWPTFAVAVQQLKPIRLFWPWLGPANRDLASFGRYGSEIVAARKGVCRGLGRCPLQRYSKSGDSHFSTLRNGLVYPAQHM